MDYSPPTAPNTGDFFRLHQRRYRIDDISINKAPLLIGVRQANSLSFILKVFERQKFT